MKRFAEARKQSELLADIERMLLKEHEQPQMQNGAVRRDDVIHPSELAKADWCPRSTWLRIRNARAGLPVKGVAPSFQLETIFEEGHEYHRKWQGRLRRMGRLFGHWLCNACDERWEGLPPEYCPECGAPAAAIDYAEVRLAAPDYLIYGHADGLVVAPAGQPLDNALLEVKSIGEGTVRMDLPAVLGRHTYEVEDKQWGRQKRVLDHRGVWKDINKPFAPHLRQGLIYLRMWGMANEAEPGDQDASRVDQIIFIYEYKPTSAVKTFTVRRNDEAVEEIFQLCADIVDALDRAGEPPSCISRDGACKACLEQETDHDHDSAAPAGRAAESVPPRRRRPREGAPSAAPAAEDGRAGTGRRPHRPRGQRADGPARGADPVGRLLGSAARRR